MENWNTMTSIQFSLMAVSLRPLKRNLHAYGLCWVCLFLKQAFFLVQSSWLWYTFCVAFRTFVALSMCWCCIFFCRCDLRLSFGISLLFLFLLFSLSIQTEWNDIGLKHVTVPLHFISYGARIFFSSLSLSLSIQTICISAGICAFYEASSIILCNYFAHFGVQLSFRYVLFFSRLFIP